MENTQTSKSWPEVFCNLRNKAPVRDIFVDWSDPHTLGEVADLWIENIVEVRATQECHWMIANDDTLALLSLAGFIESVPKENHQMMIEKGCLKKIGTLYNMDVYSDISIPLSSEMLIGSGSPLDENAVVTRIVCRNSEG